jgi:hypothetical protein
VELCRARWLAATLAQGTPKRHLSLKPERPKKAAAPELCFSGYASDSRQQLTWGMLSVAP